MNREVHGRRLAAQQLAGPPARSVEAVVERLLAIQAQDARGFRLAVRARTSGLTAADVDRALTERRSVVVSWLNRGTLHLVSAEDYAWLHALTTPQLLSGNARRLSEEGVSPSAAERGVTAVVRALGARGPMTREPLREVLAKAEVRAEGQALYHVLLLATLRGLVVRGPVVEGDQAFVLTRDWLGPPPKIPERDVALGMLARRFLAGHGPATDRDLAKWAGLVLRDARRGFSEIQRELDTLEGGLVALERAEDRDVGLPAPRLLGAFDPVLHGWESREPLLGTHGQAIVTRNGVFRPFALVEGRAVATWTLSRGEIALSPFGRMGREVSAALEADAKDVMRFLR